MSKVDIVVPCYNYGRFLEACVKSVLDQSVGDLRVLIIDDASSDNSLSVATKLAEADPRVAVISHRQNCGHIDTYNEGIAWASAEYFLLLSADDMLVPAALERATAIMDAHADVVLTYGKCIPWRDDCPVPDLGENCTAGWARDDLIRRFCRTAGDDLIACATVIVRTSVQKAIGGYRASLPQTADTEMFLRFAANGAVARINAVQAIYRIHASNMHKSHSREEDYRDLKASFDIFFAEYGSKISRHVTLQAQADRTLSEQVFWRGIARICRGQVECGRSLLRFATALNPKLRYLPPLTRIVRTPRLDLRLASLAKDVITTLGRRQRELGAHKTR